MGKKRIYSETVKNWARENKKKSGAIFLIFAFLSAMGYIQITGSSQDMRCAGTEEDPCFAFINFTSKEDNFIYPVGYDPYGRNSPFEFEPGIRAWKLQRKWGNGWRTIPLDKGCTGTWCGGKPGIKENVFSTVFRENKDYQIRIIGYKWNPSDEITWNFNPTGRWLPVEEDFSVNSECENVTRYRREEKEIIRKLNRQNCTVDGKNVSTCVNYTENVSYRVFDQVSYEIEICEETEVEVQGNQIEYNRYDRNCLRTNNTLCCWLTVDGGMNLEYRAEEFNITIRSGESGKCIDLSDNMTVKAHQTDFGDVILI